MALLIHVDDVMYVGKESFVQEQFLPKLRTQFEISEQHVKKVGDACQFLRRTYELTTEGLRIYPGKYAEDMVEAYEKELGRAKLQKLPCGQEILEPDETTPLGEHLAGLYRSLVGCGIYLAQERVDISFTVKELAGKMACPTEASLKKLGKLIGFLKPTLGQYSQLEVGEPGHGLTTRTEVSGWLLETYSDSDWSGSKSHRRSTSSAIHMLNGAVVFSSSRGQKSVSLSGAEAELNALVGSAADGIYLRRCIEFLVDETVVHHCLVDNSAALHLCRRRGPGKMRHISRKFQDLVAQDELKVKAVGTVHNVADLGRKSLPRARIQLILYWCNIFTARHERLGEDEHERMAASSANRGQITKLAKMLNRILLLEGLEQAAGHGIEEKIEKSTFPWTTCYMFHFLAGDSFGSSGMSHLQDVVVVAH